MAETLEFVARSLVDRGDAPGVVALTKDGAERVSFRQLGEQVQRLASGLIAAGVGRGEPVALFAPSRPEWVIAALAIIDAGATVVPLDAQAGDEQLAHLVADSESRRVFTTRDRVERLDKLRGSRQRTLVLLDAQDDDARSWRRLLSGERHDRPRIGPDDRAALFYTAGTTGRPKGVPLTHRNCATNLAALLDIRLVGPGDRALLPLPFHHVYPFMIGLLAPLASGATIVLPAGVTGPQVVRALRDEAITTILGVPRFYEALLAGMRGRARGRAAAASLATALGLSTWLRRRLGLRLGRLLLAPLRARFAPRVRFVASGGAKLDPEVAWALEGLGWYVAIGYGLTETSPILALTRPGDRRLDTVGRAVPGVELRIDRPNERGEGEIQARGPNVFSGYHGLPEKTAEAFTDDGWFRTGDLGRIDGDGYLSIVGRASEMIKSPAGEKVIPEEVERVYLESSVIREIGVLERDGRLVAVVLPNLAEIRKGEADAAVAVREAMAQQSARLPSHQRITEHVLTQESLPLTRLGKLRRHLLPDLYERARRGADEEGKVARPLPVETMSEEDRALLDDPAARQVWDWLVERYPDRRVAPDASPQVELGLDSLEWLTLTLELRERAGVELGEEALVKVETVRDLLREAASADEARGPAAMPLARPEEALTETQRRWLQPTGRMLSALGALVFLTNDVLARRLFRLTVRGLEHVPEDEALVFVPNHRSYLDGPILAAALPARRLRETYWGGAVTVLFTNPVTRLFSRVTRILPVDPERAAMGSLALAAATLQRGKSLVWFPEGRRSPTGELQRFLPGIGVLLERVPVRVVPVLIEGTERALPPGWALPRLTPVTVTFGEPRAPKALAERGRGEHARERIAEALHAEVADLGRRRAA
jgi:long-chain acyl-CoA synthetase